MVKPGMRTSRRYTCLVIKQAVHQRIVDRSCWTSSGSARHGRSHRQRRRGGRRRIARPRMDDRDAGRRSLVITRPRRPKDDSRDHDDRQNAADQKAPHPNIGHRLCCHLVALRTSNEQRRKNIIELKPGQILLLQRVKTGRLQIKGLIAQPLTPGCASGHVEKDRQRPVIIPLPAPSRSRAAGQRSRIPTRSLTCERETEIKPVHDGDDALRALQDVVRGA